MYIWLIFKNKISEIKLSRPRNRSTASEMLIITCWWFNPSQISQIITDNLTKSTTPTPINRHTASERLIITCFTGSTTWKVECPSVSEWLVAEGGAKRNPWYRDTHRNAKNANIKYLKRWYLFYFQRHTIGHQVGDQLEMFDPFGVVRWKHHIYIISKWKSVVKPHITTSVKIRGKTPP